MNHKRVVTTFTVGVLALLLVATCGKPLDTIRQEGYPEAVLAAREMARLTSAVAGVQIAIVSFEPVTWADSCLGAARPGEACAEAITPGWIVVLKDPGGVFAVHTDLLGERMRRGPMPTTSSGGDGAGL